jgi:hypothetical protein
VDSNDFRTILDLGLTESPSSPGPAHLKGFPIIQSTFDFKINGINCPLDPTNPTTGNTLPMLIIRNGDPLVDGIMIYSNLGSTIGVKLSIGAERTVIVAGRPVVINDAGFSLENTFGGAAFPSTDIAQCLGNYPFGSFSSVNDQCNGCLVYDWPIGAGGGSPMYMEFLGFRLWKRCGLADIAGLGGVPGDDGQNTVDDLIYYLTSFFANNASVADLVGVGGSGGPDSQVTVDDLIAYLSAFFAPCP